MSDDPPGDVELKILAELTEIADELDQITQREFALYERRIELWRLGRDLELTTMALALPSRVKPVTVRQTLTRDDKRRNQ